MQENRALLLSLGHSISSGAFSSLIHQQDGTVDGHSPNKIPSGRQDDGDCPVPEEAVEEEEEGPWDLENMKDEDVGFPAPSAEPEGKCRSSLHLCALMKLVKEIPEFLYGPAAAHVDPAATASIRKVEGDAEGLQDGEAPTENSHPPSLENDSADASGDRCGVPCTPAGCAGGDRQAPQPQATGTQDKADVTLDQLSLCNGAEKAEAVSSPGPPEAPSSDPLARSATGALGWKRAEPAAGEHLRTDTVSTETAADPECRTLPGCQKEGATDGPDPLFGTSGSISPSNGCAMQESPLPATGVRRASSHSSPNETKETAAEEKPLQGLLKCLKGLIVHQPLHSHQTPCRISPGGCPQVPRHQRREVASGSPPIQVKTELPEEDPPTQERTSPPPLKPTSSPCFLQSAGVRRMREEGILRTAAVKTEPGSASSPLLRPGRLAHSIVAHRATRKERAAEETSPLGVKNWNPAASPLHSLLNCLREIPNPSPDPTKMLAAEGGGQERRKGGRRGLLEQRDDRATPEKRCQVSSRSRTPPASTVCGLGPPLQRLDRSLKEHPLSTCSQPPSPAVSSSIGSSPDRLPRRTLETGKWMQEEEGASPPGIPPLQGLENCLKEIPTSGNALQTCFTATSSTWPPKRKRIDAETRWLWAGGGPKDILLQHPTSTSGGVQPEADAPAESSPLHRLMNCLKEVPIQRPSYLDSPSVSSSSSSSSGSETERELQSPGSEVDEPVGQETAAPGRRSSERGRGFPSPAEPELVRTGTKAVSPLCLADVAASPHFCSRSPPTDAQTQRGRRPRGPETGISGSCPASVAEPDLLHGPRDSPRDTAANLPIHSNTPSPDPFVSTAGRETEEDGLEGGHQHLCPEAAAKRRILAGGHCLQGWEDSPGDLQPVHSRHRFEAPASGSRDVRKHTSSAEEGRLRESSPLQGLLRCLQEITARGPDPCHLPSSSTPGERRRPSQAKEGAGHRRASREGLGGCVQEGPTSSPSPASTPASSPWRSPAPEAGGGLIGVAVTSAPLCAAGRCTGASGNGRGCLSNERPPSCSARRLSGCRSPKNGLKRSLTTATGGSPQGAGAVSCAFSSRGSSESESPPKKSCPSLDQPSPFCHWKRVNLQPCRAEDSDLGPVLSQKLDRLSADVNAICRDVSRLQSHMDRLALDSRGWVLELAALRMENRCLSEHVRRMESRCRTLENRCRRNHLRLLGLPEGVEGSDAVSFLQKTLPAMLGLVLDSPPLEIENAHRVQGGVSWDPNSRPRALVFRLLRFADKAAILQAARMRPLSYAGAQVTILPDFCSSPSRRKRVPFGTFRRTRWAADLCPAPRHSPCYARSHRRWGPLAGEREGTVSSGTGVSDWDTDPLTGTVHHGGCHSTGSPE